MALRAPPPAVRSDRSPDTDPPRGHDAAVWWRLLAAAVVLVVIAGEVIETRWLAGR